MEDVEEKYKFLRYTEKPDRDVEYFWYIFKDFVINTATRYPLIKDPKAYIENLSTTLNQLQEEKAYDDIQESIKEVIMTIGWLLLSTHADSHTSHLYLTFVKRWSKWASPEFTLEGTEVLALVRIHMVTFSLEEREEKEFLIDLLGDLKSPRDVFEYDFEELFLLGIRTGKTAILNNLKPFLDFEEVSMKHFGVKVHKQTKGQKVIRLLQGRKVLLQYSPSSEVSNSGLEEQAVGVGVGAIMGAIEKDGVLERLRPHQSLKRFPDSHSPYCPSQL